MNDDDLPLPAPPRSRWIETAVFTALAAAALWWTGPSPYLALAPLLTGARYGALHGLSSGLLLTVASAAAPLAFPLVPPTDAGAALAWLIAGGIPGAFRDEWARRIRGLEVTSNVLRRRLDDLGRAHHALRASHDRLQTVVPGQPSTLRAALEDLRGALLELPAGSDAVARRVLDLLRDHAGVRAATWHAVGAAREPGPALASLGTGGPAEGDAVIRDAARLGEVVSIRDFERLERGGALAGVPIVDVEGKVHAVVAVRDIPFVAIHDDTLSLLAVLGGHVGDLLSLLRALPVDASEVPQPVFCAGLSRAIRDARRYGVPSSLVVVGFRPEAPLTKAASGALRKGARQLAAARRATDLSDVLLDADECPRVFTLLRLADAEGLSRCAARLEAHARDLVDAIGLRCEVEVVGWRLDRAPLPADPADLEAFLLSLLRDRARKEASASDEKSDPGRYQLA